RRPQLDRTQACTGEPVWVRAARLGPVPVSRSRPRRVDRRHVRVGPRRGRGGPRRDGRLLDHVPAVHQAVGCRMYGEAGIHYGLNIDGYEYSAWARITSPTARVSAWTGPSPPAPVSLVSTGRLGRKRSKPGHLPR